jgi:phosphatidate cytidylyltransferase
VVGADPAQQQRALEARGNELVLRVASALVLVPLAIVTAYVGGWPFAVFWSAAAVGVLWEWMSLVTQADRRAVLVASAACLVLTLALLTSGHQLASVIVLAMGVLAAAALAPAARRIWVAAGLPYAGAIGIAPIALRSGGDEGFLAILFVFATVWATDICAYFTGRAIGGPKLMPTVSPKKTWSGALGGTIAAVVAGLAVAKASGLSVVAQAGDLFESFLKRKFGAKDSGHLIPGHGGLMDRLDGFVAASVVAALIGLARGGFEAPGRGLMVW